MFDPNNIKLGENLYKNTIGYMMINGLKYVKISSVNPFFIHYYQSSE